MKYETYTYVLLHFLRNKESLQNLLVNVFSLFSVAFCEEKSDILCSFITRNNENGPK